VTFELLLHNNDFNPCLKFIRCWLVVFLLSFGILQHNIERDDALSIFCDGGNYYSERRFGSVFRYYQVLAV